MADILVTGATGLLGSAVVTALAADHQVVAVARRPPAQSAGVEWITHDLRRPALPDNLPSHIDVVIHLAQAREFRDFPSRAVDIFAVNVASTVLLADWACAAGARTFMVASTGGVYQPGPAPHGENEAVGGPGVPSFYAASKLAAESLARAYSLHMNVVVFRPFFIYGRGQAAGMLFPRLVNSIRSRQPIVIDGQAGMRFNPIHVSDAARAVAAALALEDSCVVNLAGPQVVSLRETAELLAAPLGIDPELDVRPKVAPMDCIADISAMTARLGSPTKALVDVVAELCG